MEVHNRNPKIYIITGKARHGKDTTAGIIAKIYKKQNLKSINLSYASYIKEYAKKICDWDGSDETKPRELLQQLGTDVIRKNIDQLFFINRIIEDIKVYSYFFDIITVSDGRFRMEVDIPREQLDNVIAVRINRPNFDNGLTEEQKRHQSEIDLDDYEKFDIRLENDGTIKDLEKKVEKIIGR